MKKMDQSNKDGAKIFQEGDPNFKKKVLQSLIADYEKIIKGKTKKSEKERAEIKMGIMKRMLKKIAPEETENIKYGEDILEDEVEQVRIALNSIKEHLSVPKDLTVVIVKDPKQCEKLKLGLGIAKMQKFMKKCMECTTSYAYQIGRHNFVIFRISKENKKVTNNLDATTGLLAHEIMHIKERESGYLKQIRKAFKNEFVLFFEKFVKSNFEKSYEKKAIYAKEIGRALNMGIKDLYANAELIKNGLGDYLLAYYLMLFENEKEAKIKKGDWEEKINKILFGMYVFPILLQFKNYKHESAKKLVQIINQNYSNNILFLNKNFKKTMGYISKNFDYSKEFQENYFKKLFSDIIKITNG